MGSRTRHGGDSDASEGRVSAASAIWRSTPFPRDTDKEARCQHAPREARAAARRTYHSDVVPRERFPAVQSWRASHTSRSRSAVQIRGWSIPSSSSHARCTLNGMVGRRSGSRRSAARAPHGPRSYASFRRAAGSRTSRVPSRVVRRKARVSSIAWSTCRAPHDRAATAHQLRGAERASRRRACRPTSRRRARRPCTAPPAPRRGRRRSRSARRGARRRGRPTCGRARGSAARPRGRRRPGSVASANVSRRPGQARDRLRALEEPRHAALLAGPVLRPALLDQVRGGFGG